MSIADKLRSLSASAEGHDNAAANLLAEAADEIERLTTALDLSEQMVSVFIKQHGEMKSLCANGKYLTKEERAAVVFALLVFSLGEIPGVRCAVSNECIRDAAVKRHSDALGFLLARLP